MEKKRRMAKKTKKKMAEAATSPRYFDERLFARRPIYYIQKSTRTVPGGKGSIDASPGG